VRSYTRIGRTTAEIAVPAALIVSAAAQRRKAEL
jgi:hypothetical protein